MSNDIFIREVNEELRQERARALWVRYGAAAIAVAVLIVLGVGAYVLWERHRAGLEAADGDRLINATTLLAESKTEEARAILTALSNEGVANYPVLARLRLAQLDVATDPAKAVAGFDAVANDASAPAHLRDMAAIRAGYILVDTGSLADVRNRVERLTSDGQAQRYAAREAIGLAAWKSGDVETARTFFSELQDDLGTPGGIKQRAGLMIELIEASAGPKAGSETSESAPADDAETAEGATPPAAVTPPAAATPPAPAAEPPPAAAPSNQPPA